MISLQRKLIHHRPLAGFFHDDCGDGAVGAEKSRIELRLDKSGQN